MAKGIVTAVCFAATTIVLFFVMVYLMTTVDPPKLLDPESPEFEEAATTVVSVTEEAGATDAVGTRKYDKIFFNDDGLIPFIDSAQYGLERAEMDVLSYYRTTSSFRSYNGANLTGILRYSPRKVIPPLWPRATRTIIIDPSINELIPSIWPPNPTSSAAPMMSRTASRLDTTSLDYNDNTQKSDYNLKNETSVKPMKRRSVSNYKIDKSSGSLILKILDNIGHARIEIKLSADKNFKKKKAKEFRRFFKNKSKFTMQSDEDDLLKNTDVLKDRIINIMPNESVVVDEAEGELISEKELSEITNITDLLTSILLASTREKNKESNNTELTDDVVENEIENINNETTTEKLQEVVLDKEFFGNNIVKPYNVDMENSTDFYSSINSSTEFDRPLDTTTVSTTKNITDIDNMVNAKINNTEFNKIIFED